MTETEKCLFRIILNKHFFLKKFFDPYRVTR